MPQLNGTIESNDPLDAGTYKPRSHPRLMPFHPLSNTRQLTTIRSTT